MESPEENVRRRVEALDIDGSFFPRRCADEFRTGARWQIVAEEHPVYYPREGPPANQVESAADIIVAAGSGWNHSRAFLCVECKKADPRFREWIFFRKYGQHHFFRNLALGRGTDTGPWQKIALRGNLVDPLCDYGRELPVSSDESRRTTSHRIQEAARQAALAVRSFADEVSRGIPAPTSEASRTVRPLQWSSQSLPLYFVPVVVTTAKLMICDFKASDIDLLSGRLQPEAEKFEERPWVVYDYPLTGGLGFESDGIDLTKEESNPLEALTKMHVLFLQSGSLNALARTCFPLTSLLAGWEGPR